MRLIACMACRNEDWVLGLSLRVALLWVDAVVILLHSCGDASGDIVEAVIREHERGRIHVIRESGPWEEMRHREAMLAEARRQGATHISIVDADEVLSGDCLGKCIKQPPAGMPDNTIVQLPLYNLRGSIDSYHANGLWSNRWVSIAFSDNPALHWAGDRFHHREPFGMTMNPWRPLQQGHGGVLHLWGASERRLIAKHALYKVVERIRWPQKRITDIDREYNMAVKNTGWSFADVPAAWWAPYSHLMKHLHVDATPWQETEVRRLVKHYGRDYFAGLDLFGVA